MTAVTGLSYSLDWDEYVNHNQFSNGVWYGYQDDMLTGGIEWLDAYGMRMEAYFIPPATGIYFFKIFCDNNCIFNIGDSDTSKSTIVDFRINQWVPYLTQWYDSSFNSCFVDFAFLSILFWFFISFIYSFGVH